MSVIRSLALALVAALFAFGLRADIIQMKDGRVYEGKILSETRTQVVIDTKLHNIRTEMTLRKRDIESIERKDLPEGFWDPPKRDTTNRDNTNDSTTSDSSTNADANDLPRYIVIPLEGTFGIEIRAEGVISVLNTASRRGVDHIVFHIDSGGGYIYAAELIAEAMKKHDEEYTYTVIVDQAISASIWVVLGCDHVIMRPGSTVGGAVVYSTDSSTGDAEVDAKMNSIIAAQRAAAAEEKGHPGDVARAMMLMEAELWSWKDENSELQLGGTKPTDRSFTEVTQLDGHDTVLTLTAEEAERIGLGSVDETEIESLGMVLGLETDWKEQAGSIGKKAMQTAYRSYQRNQQRIDDAREKYSDLRFEVYSALSELRIDLMRAINMASNRDQMRNALRGCRSELRRIASDVKALERAAKRYVELTGQEYEQPAWIDAIKDDMEELDRRLDQAERSL